MIVVNIEVGKIPTDQIVEKNGRRYINIIVDEKKEPNEWGHTHSVYMSQTKEEKANREPKIYIGNGKEFKFRNGADRAREENNRRSSAYIPDREVGSNDDLPF